MLGFPLPYSKELLYSTIARAGVHDGDTSPKQLLDKVFNNRRVIATVDLPSHVQTLADQYPKTLGMDANTLISRHTLWPIYAPFLPHERNNKLRKWMSRNSQGAAHLASGITASRVKTKTRFYACIECLKEQKMKYGESFWDRLWQVPLVKACPAHGSLNATSIKLDGEHRHTYISVEAAEIQETVEIAPVDSIFSQQVAQLMLVESQGISTAQWTAFYKNFALSQGYKCASRVDHTKIHDTVIKFWGKSWLEEAGIIPSDSETSWLKALFRKHRKSFSFAEHIVTVLAISNGTVSICDAIDAASKMVVVNVNSHRELVQNSVSDAALNQDQVQWKQLLERSSPKQARKGKPALYARLYRNHYNWLMHINQFFHADRIMVNNRIDWSQRDRKIARELLHTCNVLLEDLNAPHLSRTFLIHQLEHRATVEKNLHRLPRCSKLLSLYSESTPEYQARRLTRAYLSMLKSRRKVKRWSLLRQAGLSDERMTTIVAEFLKEILREHARSKI